MCVKYLIAQVDYPATENSYQNLFRSDWIEKMVKLNANDWCMFQEVHELLGQPLGPCKIADVARETLPLDTSTLVSLCILLWVRLKLVCW